jgi:hypothetical protein
MRATKGKTKQPKKIGNKNIMATSTMLKQLSIAAGAAILSFGFSEAAFAAGFTGAYSADNWQLTNRRTNGYVDTSGAPDSILQIGGNAAENNFLSSRGQTRYTTTAAGSGSVSFDWNYSTNDHANRDPFGVVLNGIFTRLTLPEGNRQSGSYSFNVLKGDIFGFGIQTVDNRYGAGQVQISNFNAPKDVPEPITGLVLAAGMGGAALRRAKKSKQN